MALREARRHYLARLVERLPADAASPEEGEYLNLLDRVLKDRIISSDEALSLVSTAEAWGLSPSLRRSHHTVCRGLTNEAGDV